MDDVYESCITVFVKLSYWIVPLKRADGVSQSPNIDLSYFGFSVRDTNKDKIRHKFHRAVTLPSL